jgi:NADH pyrophosphatase NudC (nudix superfamily)
MANYCPQCGTKTNCAPVAGRDRSTCPQCGWVEFANVSLGIGALVIRGGSVLLVERAIPPVGLWTIPSGYVEQDDNILEAVKREVREEAGLDVTPKGIIWLRNITEPQRNDLYIVFLCEPDNGSEPVPDGEESTQARYVHPDDFDKVNISATSRLIAKSYLNGHLKPLIQIAYDRQNAIAFASE